MTNGLNFFGSSDTSDGIGRAAALNIECLNNSNLPYEMFVLSRPVALQTGKNTIIDDQLLSSLKHRVNIFQFSARWVPHYFSQLKQSALDGFYNIGYWFCEVPQIPDQWARQLEYFDEIWTASTFCQTAIARSANVPVVKIPLFIEPRAMSKRVTERLSGTCSQPFTFLTVFNAYSDAERKNPLFTTRAFLQAHGNNMNVRLIIKVSNLEYDLNLMVALERIREKHPNVQVIQGYVETNQIQDLYENTDVYVSLHRAEGFGLTISDAMSRGIPVITTGYSGNMEFCSPSDTRLVDYKLRNIGHERLRYRSRDIWAEPDLADAALAFYEATNNYALFANKAASARVRIANDFSISTITKLMMERLEMIHSNFTYLNDMTERPVDREVGIYDTYGF